VGDQNTHIGPYRNLEMRDFATTEQKKRLSDMFALMRPVENALKERQEWQRQPTLDQVNGMWAAAEGVIAVEGRTSKGRKRRVKQLAWSTQLREYRKRPRGALADDSEQGDEEESA
jgi:hypothetical protein